MRLPFSLCFLEMHNFRILFIIMSPPPWGSEVGRYSLTWMLWTRSMRNLNSIHTILRWNVICECPSLPFSLVQTSWPLFCCNWFYIYQCLYIQCRSALKLLVLFLVFCTLIQHVIKCVSYLRQISGFLWITQFPSPVKLTALK